MKNLSDASQSITVSIVELEQSLVCLMACKEEYKINGFIHNLFRLPVLSFCSV